MNALATIIVVSATVLFAPKLVRCQTDRVDNKYLDPNDYFLAGENQQDRRRIQDTFNRYSFHIHYLRFMVIPTCCVFMCLRIIPALRKSLINGK